ncbi:MAG: hypothetical protein V7K14_21430 [Nostoc sp.]|uniref:hypothetical protein n=1 Tax=Nostoc sp. TaxID=1180 RepID=UPI002FF6ABC7
MAKLRRRGFQIIAIADVFDTEAVKAAVIHAQSEVVIEQLTALPNTYTGESMSAAAPLNQRLRQEGGANVLAAAQAAGVQRLRGVLNAKAKRELNFQPRPLQWMVDTTVACAS